MKYKISRTRADPSLDHWTIYYKSEEMEPHMGTMAICASIAAAYIRLGRTPPAKLGEPVMASKDTGRVEWGLDKKGNPYFRVMGIDAARVV